MDTVQIQKIISDGTQDPLKYWTELIGIPIGIITVLVLIVQTYLGNKSRKAEIRSKQKELQGKDEELKNKKIEMRWNQLAKAKELIDEMRNDKDAYNAMMILDFMHPEFKISDTEKKIATTDDVKEALSFSYDQHLYDLIRDSFDSLFYYYSLFEHQIAIGLVSFDDISFPAEYYVRRMRLSVPGINPQLFLNYMEQTHSTRALSFIHRFESVVVEEKKVNHSMPKNIVICCDGTGNEFSKNNSNVVKLYSVLEQNSEQVSYYHPGVGTLGSKNALSAIGKTWTRLIGLAFGYGISENIADAYQFLMRNYEEGDRIYVFGFSRGAYTARALCGLLHMFGLLTKGNEALIPYAIRLAKQKEPDFKLISKFKATFSHPCKTHFLGVWDTVTSVGWVYDAVHFPYTTKNPDLHIVRHSMSVDERRAFFRQDLFANATPNQDIKQIWFPGVHCDVGGGYAENESGLSKIGFKWIMDEAKQNGLLVDEQKAKNILGADKKFTAPDPKGELHKSLKGLWWIAEFFPKIHRTPVIGNGKKQWKRSLRINLARPRYIDASTAILDDSVRERMKEIPSYRPPNII